MRYGDQWLFVSFAGRVHPVDVSGQAPRPLEPWSLAREDRDDGWRTGGVQHLAVHQASGLFYVLMHRGGPDTHKEPGRELRVYDLATRERVRRIELRHPGIAFLSEQIAFGEAWIWPFDRLWGLLLELFVYLLDKLRSPCILSTRAQRHPQDRLPAVHEGMAATWQIEGTIGSAR